MNFIPKHHLTLRQAMERAGPVIVPNWTGAELDRCSSKCPEFSRRNDIVIWFRHELFAKSFSCSYWSDARRFKKIPSEAFSLDESNCLFEFDEEPIEFKSDLEPPFLDDVSLNPKFNGGRTWVDGFPSSPYYLPDLIESVRVRELFISQDGFQTVLSLAMNLPMENHDVVYRSLDPGGALGVHTRPSNRPPEKRDAAIRVLRQLSPVLVAGKLEALLSEVNTRLNSPVSIDTLRRARAKFWTDAKP